MFATACESERIFVWDAAKRELQRTCSIGYKGRSCAFSSDGKHLAVGTRSGRVRVLDAELHSSKADHRNDGVAQRMLEQDNIKLQATSSFKQHQASSSFELQAATRFKPL